MEESQGPKPTLKKEWLRNPSCSAAVNAGGQKNVNNNKALTFIMLKCEIHIDGQCIGHSLLSCIPHLMNPSFTASLLSCIPPVIHACIQPFLYPYCPAFLPFHIPPVMNPPFLHSSLRSCIPQVLNPSRAESLISFIPPESSFPFPTFDLRFSIIFYT